MPEECRKAIRAILAFSQEARTASQVRKELTGSFRISSKETTALLSRMAAGGEIFPWPGKRYWDRSPEEQARRHILVRLADSPFQSVARIRAALKLPQEVIGPVLEQLAAEGRVHVWLPGKSPMYGLVDPHEAARDAILQALQSDLLDEKRLVGRIRYRLPGYTAGLLREHLPPLLRSGQVLEHPRYRKTRARYGSAPPDPADYLGTAIEEIKAVHEVLASSGIPLDRIFAALGRKLGLSGDPAALPAPGAEKKPASPETEGLILQAITRLQPLGQGRALVPIRDLRRSLRLSKNEFDTGVFSLALNRRVALHPHDFPASLSEGEREELVRDEQGTFYVGIVPKEV